MLGRGVGKYIQVAVLISLVITVSCANVVCLTLWTASSTWAHNAFYVALALLVYSFRTALKPFTTTPDSIWTLYEEHV